MKEEKKKYVIPKISAKKLAQNKVDKETGDIEMDAFWLAAEQELAKHPYCMECGAFIPAYETINDETGKVFLRGYRAATAHIFPKAIFPSVKAHYLNRLLLGADCGCHNKTHRLDTFSEMKVFPMAVNNFNQFKHLITEKHKYLWEFKNYANGTI